MSEHIAGVLLDWSERNSVPGRVFRKAKKVARPVPKGSPVTGAATARRHLERTVNKHTEVMVKITGGGKNLKAIKAHMAYISRKGTLEVEDQDGFTHQGKHAIKEIADEWGDHARGIPRDGERRKEAINIILSMPPGTDRLAVHDSARAFASAEFSNHPYLFVSHEDEAHPHVHLTVKVTGHDGKRLNPRKRDLQRWREMFAESLRERGVEANATTRRVRGVVKKPKKQSIVHIDRDFLADTREQPARVTTEQARAVVAESRDGIKHENPAEEAIRSARLAVIEDFERVAAALGKGSLADQQLADSVRHYVSDLPPLSSQHQIQVTRYLVARDQAGRATDADKEHEHILSLDR